MESLDPPYIPKKRGRPRRGEIREPITQEEKDRRNREYVRRYNQKHSAKKVELVFSIPPPPILSAPSSSSG